MQERHPLKQSAQLEERMTEEAVRLRKQAQGTPPGIERERLIRRARQAETAAQLSEWLRSSGPHAARQGH
jgi:predicted trehalose synthase